MASAAVKPEIIGWSSFEANIIKNNSAPHSPKQALSNNIAGNQIIEEMGMLEEDSTGTQPKYLEMYCLLLSSYRASSRWEYGYLGSTHKVYHVL